MIFLRKILFPFAVLYGWITQFRNFLFDRDILKSYRFDVPVIAVGNLSVGGTGKTPQIEYLIRLLAGQYNVATLSRGYKRKSKGFILADADSDASILGDEPFQFYQKFPNITVAVDANRKSGIKKLLSLVPKPDIILLDDAFQHRKVKAEFYILLTTYNDLFCDDFMLPTGNLRESRSGAKRSDVIIVTKCPETISETERQKIIKKIGVNRPVFFSAIAYDDCVYAEGSTIEVSKIRHCDKLLLAGIAKPKPFFDYLQHQNDTMLTFPDHHHFNETDIRNIQLKAGNLPIITTEKDYVRLKNDIPRAQLFFLPIKTSFIFERENFDKMILSFLQKI